SRNGPHPLQLRQALGVDERQDQQHGDSQRLQGERSQRGPASTRASGPVSFEQTIGKHRVLQSRTDSSKDTVEEASGGSHTQKKGRATCATLRTFAALEVSRSDLFRLISGLGG